MITLRYERVVEQFQGRGLGELQRYQDVAREMAGIHLGVITLMTGGAGDEQAVYLESRKVADALDALINRTLSGAGTPAVPASPIEAELAKAVAAYRSDILLCLEMMTVNPRLAERYLLRSASSLGRLNIAVTSNFNERRSDIQADMRAIRNETVLEVSVLIAIMLVAGGVVMAAALRLTRRLARNFRSVEGALTRLEADAGSPSPASDPVDGEFQAIAGSLERFGVVLAERDFSRSQMRAIFDSILEAVVVIDDHGRVIQTNPTVQELFGYLPEELVGQNVSILTPPEIERQHDDYLARYRAGTSSGRVVGNVRTTEGRRRDGSLFPVQLAVSAISIRGKKYFVGVIADITEQVENERLLREARDAALSSARLKAEFLATMSHEIRTPMNGILGMAQLLVADDVGDEERRQCARILLGSSETLITLLNDILDLSKVEAGKLAFRPEPASPAVLAEQTAALFADAAQAKGLRLTLTTTPAARGIFMLDPTRVRQMLSNLVGNAVKFTEAGEIRIDLQVEAADEVSGVLLFRVTDTGAGIAPRDIPRLFGKYSQLDASSTRIHGGSGLGLSIVRQFATALQGDVGVDSTPGAGSAFWFSIPARKAQPGAAPQAAGARAVAALADASTTTHRGRVLIAEDIAANRVFLQLALRRLGVATETVNDGRAALEAVMRNGPFDCIFMDVRMPEMDGEEATRRIRQWEADTARARCPIIAVTANAYDDDRHSCRDAGMDDFVAKPLKLEELQRVLEHWVRAANPPAPH